MKKLNVFILVLLSFQASAQTTEKAVEVLSPQIFFLNSAAGSSRQVIPFQLPDNTIRWYYTFSAFRNAQDVKSTQSQFNLLSKLSYLIDQTGTTANAISLLDKPPGSDYCDVILLNSSSDVSLFSNKADVWGGKYLYDLASSRKNFVSGVVEIDEANRLSGWQYLGFRNPSLYGINVSIQIVAIVKQEATSNGWTKEQKNTYFKRLESAFNTAGISNIITNDQIDGLTGCMLEKITSTYTPDQISGYADYELNKTIGDIAKQCMKDLNIQIDDNQINSQSVKQNLIGTWKDENSTFIIYENGTLLMTWDNGKSAWGTWAIKNGQLELKFNNINRVDDYYLLKISSTEMQYQISDSAKDQTIYNATKINT